MIENIKDIKDKFDNFKPYINGYQNMKRASVLVPIIKNNDSHEILFEVRSKTLRSQPNEIAFPGGKIEENETPREACIRYRNNFSPRFIYKPLKLNNSSIFRRYKRKGSEKWTRKFTYK